MSKERLNIGHEAYSKNPEAIREAGEKAHERLREDIERKAESAPEKNIESARHEALEKAKSKEHKTNSKERESRTPETSPENVVTKADRKASYDRTMAEARSHMSPASKAFSKVIHQPAIEKVSAVAGATIARPNAILSGAMFAFFLTLGVYLIGRHLGYPLSGFETIAAFIFGWVLGITYDFLRVMITGKKA